MDPLSRSSSSLANWGLSFGYQFPFGISLNASVEQTNGEFIDRVFGDNQTNVEDRYSISADIGRIVQRGLKLKSTPSISASWTRSETDQISSFNDQETMSSSFVLNVGISF